MGKPSPKQTAAQQQAAAIAAEDLPGIDNDLTAEDVIDPRRTYSAAAIRQRLGPGISTAAIYSDFRCGHFGSVNYRGFPGDDNFELSGAAWLRWIRIGKIPHQVQRGVKRYQDEAAAAAAAKAPPAAPIEPMDPAAAMLAQEEEDERERDAAFRRDAWREYARVLLLPERDDQDNDNLVAVAHDLGLRAEDLKEHREILEKAGRAVAIHGRIAELEKAATVAVQDFRAVEKRCKAEVDAARKAKGHAQGEFQRAKDAHFTLLQLRAQCPQLFIQAADGGPPRPIATA